MAVAITRIEISAEALRGTARWTRDGYAGPAALPVEAPEGTVQTVPVDQPGQAIKRVALIDDVVEAVAEKVVARRAFLLLGAHRKTPEINTKSTIPGIQQYFRSEKIP